MQGDSARRAYLLDGALAAAITAAVAAAAWAASSPGALDLLLLVTGSLALASTTAAPPRAVLAVTTLCLFGYVVLAQPGSWAAFPVVVAVHAAARSGHRAYGIGAGAAFLAGYTGVLLASGPGAGRPSSGRCSCSAGSSAPESPG